MWVERNILYIKTKIILISMYNTVFAKYKVFFINMLTLKEYFFPKGLELDMKTKKAGSF